MCVVFAGSFAKLRQSRAIDSYRLRHIRATQRGHGRRDENINLIGSANIPALTWMIRVSRQKTQNGNSPAKLKQTIEDKMRDKVFCLLCISFVVEITKCMCAKMAMMRMFVLAGAQSYLLRLLCHCIYTHKCTLLLSSSTSESWLSWSWICLCSLRIQAQAYWALCQNLSMLFGQNCVKTADYRRESDLVKLMMPIFRQLVCATFRTICKLIYYCWKSAHTSHNMSWCTHICEHTCTVHTHEAKNLLRSLEMLPPQQTNYSACCPACRKSKSSPMGAHKWADL